MNGEVMTEVVHRSSIRHYPQKESDNTFVACSGHYAISTLVESSTATSNPQIFFSILQPGRERWLILDSPKYGMILDGPYHSSLTTLDRRSNMTTAGRQRVNIPHQQRSIRMDSQRKVRGI